MVSVAQLPAASSAARRIRIMVPCMTMALTSLRCTMPMSKKPAYSAFMAQCMTERSPSRWSCGACTKPTLGSANSGTRSLSQFGSTT